MKAKDKAVLIVVSIITFILLVLCGVLFFPTLNQRLYPEGINSPVREINNGVVTLKNGQMYSENQLIVILEKDYPVDDFEYTCEGRTIEIDKSLADIGFLRLIFSGEHMTYDEINKEMEQICHIEGVESVRLNFVIELDEKEPLIVPDVEPYPEQ